MRTHIDADDQSLLLLALIHCCSCWFRADACCGDLDLIVAMHGTLMGLGRQFACKRWICVALIIEYCVFVAGS